MPATIRLPGGRLKRRSSRYLETSAAADRWIVFSGSAQKGTQPEQLFRIRTDGSGLRQLTTGGRVATAPSFSPDGKRVVFARLGSGLFVINLDGSGLHRLTGNPNDASPVWSPDGRWIAFIRPNSGAERLWS
jgi:TolB protein